MTLHCSDSAAGFLHDSVTKLRATQRERLPPSGGQYVHMPVCVHTHVAVVPVCTFGIGRRCCLLFLMEMEKILGEVARKLEKYVSKEKQLGDV